MQTKKAPAKPAAWTHERPNALSRMGVPDADPEHVGVGVEEVGDNAFHERARRGLGGGAATAFRRRLPTPR